MKPSPAKGNNHFGFIRTCLAIQRGQIRAASAASAVSDEIKAMTGCIFGLQERIAIPWRQIVSNLPMARKSFFHGGSLCYRLPTALVAHLVEHLI